MDGTRNLLTGLLVAGLALATLIGGALAPQSALAATLYVSEFASPNGSTGSTSAPGVFPQPAITDQTVSITGASVQSAAFSAGTHAIQVECDTDCSVVIGTNPTATTTNFLMGDGIPYQFVVIPGQKIAVIANTSGGNGSDVNIAAIGGTIVSTGDGTTHGGHHAVTLSSDSTGQVNAVPKAASGNGATYTHIAAGQATTTVKSGAGTLYAIIFNSKATATSTMVIYDNTTATGTVIGQPDATTTIPGQGPNYGPTGLAFTTGLTIITATANGADMTVIWK